MLPLEDRVLLGDLFVGIQLAPDTAEEIMEMLGRDASTM